MADNTTTANKKDKSFAGKLTDTIDAALDRDIREKLITARIALLLKAPFFGNMATRLKLVNADSWCGTAATDGRNFYYNTDFVNKLKQKEIEFLFGHEVLHNVYDHIGRTTLDMDRQLANVAADYCVNADLIEHKIGEKITTVPCLFEPKYKGWSFEEVYDDLYDKAEKIDLESLVDQLLDDHLDDQDNDEGDEGDNGESSGKGKGKGRPRLTEEEKRQIKDEIREAVLSAAQASGAGNLPGNVKRMIKDLTEPKMNWRELLEQQIQSTVKSDFTWMRPSRRGWHQDAVMPGMKPGEQIDVTVAIDTSGSITNDDLRAFLSEVKGIMDSYDEYKIHVITWDTEVYNPQVFTSENMDDILDYQPGGGGGTDPHCVWDWMKDNDIEPKRLIMFTDFEFFGWRPKEVESYCETVWVIKGNENAEPEFGIWAHYDLDKKNRR